MGPVDGYLRTEMDSSVRVTRHANDNYFTVEGKDGSIKFYGRTSAERQVNNTSSNSVIQWALSRACDSIGNCINYRYDQVTSGDTKGSDFRLAQIAYAYAEQASSSSYVTQSNPNALIEFLYETEARDDSSSVYIAGKEIKSTKRLKEIQVKSRLSPSDTYNELRRYTLHYERFAPSDAYARSYLVGIQECVVAECLSATQFSWAQNNSKEFGAQTWSGRLHYEKGHSFLGDLIPFDMNGDGYMDIAWVENDHVHANSYYNALVRYVVYDPVNKTYVGPSFSNGEYHRYISGDRGENTASDKGWVRLHALDYNADGKMDLAFYMNGFNEWEIHTAVNDGKEWKLASEHVKVSADLSSVMLDVDADGLVDILGFSSLHRLKKSNSGTLVNPYSYQAAAAPSWSYTVRPFSANPAPTQGRLPKVGNYKKLISAGDFNGDGAADVILIDRKFAGQIRLTSVEVCDYIEEHYYAMLNNGTGSSFSEFAYLGSAKEINVEKSRCHVEVDSGPILAIHTPNLNNDAYTDLMIRRGKAYYYFLNSGAGYVGAAIQSSSPSEVAGTTIQKNTLTGGRLAIQFSTEAAAKSNYINFVDINNDGFADLVTGSSNQYDYRLWHPAATKLAETSQRLTFPALSGSTNKYFFLDATGDGHLDFLRVFDDHLIGLHPNKTTGVNDLIVEIKNGLGAKTAINYELLNASQNYQSFEKRLAFERVGYNADGQPYTYLGATNNTNPLANFYTLIRNPFSGPLTKEQTLISKFAAPVFEYMAPVNLVTKVTGDSPSWDPAIGQTNTYYGNTKAEVDYYYSGARVQAGGRGFLGFRSVATKDPQSGVIVETRYRQDWPFVGVPESTISYAPTTLTPNQNLFNVYAQSIKYDQHKLQNWVSAWPDSANVANGTAALGPMKIYLARSEEVSFQFSTSSTSATSAITPKLVSGANWCATYTGSAGCNLFPQTKTQTVLQRNVTTQVYDAENNPTEISVVTQGPEIKQTQKTVNDFGPSNSLTLPASNGVNRAAFKYPALGRLKSATVTATQEREGQTTTSVSKKSVFTYFASGKYAGLLESETAFATLGDDYEQKSVYAYDIFGNKNSITTEAKTISYDRAGVRTVGPTQARTARTEFDSTWRYLARSYKNFGAPVNERLMEEVTGRAPNGAPTSVRSGINYTINFTEYDVLGREIGRSSNHGSNVWSETDHLACNNDLACPAGTAFVIETRGSDGSLTRSYTDALARTIRQASKNFRGTMTYVDTQYDKLGRVIRTSQPFEANTTALYWTENRYDVLGRVIETRAPDQGVSKFQYDGYKTVLTNALNVTKEETRNGFGELVKVSDYIGASLEYKYDTRGQLTEIFKQRGSNDYRFYANGDPDYATGVGGPTIFIEYDAIGRKTKMIDPDKGTWEYRYNAFGELLWQKDGKGQVQLQKYDAIGRLMTRTDYKANGAVENHTRWYYDGYTDWGSLGDFVGQVTAVIMTDRAGDSLTCSLANGARQCNYFSFDMYGRAMESYSNLYADGKFQGNYSSRVEYDDFGRVSIEYDAAHRTVMNTSGAPISSGTRNHYSEVNGELEKVVDLASGIEVYKVLEKSVRGQPGKVVYGNGLTTQYHYYDATGLLNTQKTTNALNVLIQDHAYSWDKMANLKWRTNYGKRSDGSNYSVNESFCYDDLNRLTRAYTATISGGCGATPSSGTVNITAYDSSGNIREKYTRSGSNTISGLTRMQYDALSSAGYSTYGGRHALTRTFDANGQVIRYKYDQNGNMIMDETGRSIEYSTYDMPTRIAKGAHTTLFAYGADRGRYWRKDTSGSQTVETLYLGNVERITKGATVIWKRYIAGVAIYETKTNINNQVLSGTATYRNYVHKDHLGSVDMITGSSGNMLESMRFSVWGTRTFTPFPPNAYTVFSLFEAQRTTKGFTGHEMLDDTGLVHMNGRIYDPALGRFLQADPFIQASTNTQSYNRYSYVFNNPLNAVDPSGFISSAFYEVKRGIGVIIAVAMTVYCQGACAAEAYAFAAAFAAAVNGADGKGILVAAVSAYAGAAVIGNSGLQLGEKVLYSATVGGVAATLTGGKFGHGFVASGIGAYFGGAKWMVDVGAPLRVGIAAIVGGTSSELTGGKFKNGAGTAAFMAIVSLAANRDKPPESDVKARKGEKVITDPELRGQIDAKIASVVAENDLYKVGQFNSPQQAAAALNDSGLYDITEDYGIELWANIDENNNIIKVGTGYSDSYAHGVQKLYNPAKGHSYWHTHPGGSRSLSVGDIDFMVRHTPFVEKGWAFASLSGGAMQGYDFSSGQFHSSRALANFVGEINVHNYKSGVWSAGVIRVLDY